ncbi:MAG: hypothetical protein KAT05_16635, partial [Spirochaetes bacterium]|nr:hypothetical protein [Spirochaetota bacterium]
SKLSGLKTKIDQLGVAIADYVDNTNDFETSTRDASVHFYTNDLYSRYYPYYDLYSLCSEIINDYDATLDIVAQEVIDELANVVVRAYAGSSHGDYYGDGADVKRGLSIFFSRGNLTHLSKSHYTYQWWYTAEDTDLWSSGYYYGLIDFCDSTADGTVESWRELMEYWYDNPDVATPSSW